MLLLSAMMENYLKHTKTSCVVKMTKKKQLWQLSCGAGRVEGAAAVNAMKHMKKLQRKVFMSVKKQRRLNMNKLLTLRTQGIVT